MRILFITSTRIGDAILSSGVLAHLIETYPGAGITVACGPLAAPLFRHAPGVDRVHVMRKRRFAGHWLSLLAATIGISWDLVVDLRGSATAYLLRARERRILTADDRQHRVVHNAAVMGLKEPPAPKLWPGETARAAARALIPEGRPVLAIGPTANWPRKAWPMDYFATLITQLTGPGGALEDAYVMIEGAPGEDEVVRPLIDAVPPARLINQVGSDLNTAYACFERIRLYIGNDSGLMHLAAAAGAPTLGLFGPSPEELYAPWGPKAAFVRGPRTCQDIVGAPGFDLTSPDSTMTDLTVDKVRHAAQQLLDRTMEGASS
mgnify:CR=1 FL=1